MSESANSVSQVCENSLTTLKDEVDPEELPPRTISHTTRRPRFGTGNVPLSPYILIDGRKLRSSLALSKKKPPRRVSFPTNDNHLIMGYLEPANPWKLAENVNHEDLIRAYKDSCIKHNSDPLETVINQLENLDTSELRHEELNLKGEILNINRAEPLEEIFKRVQFNKVNLEATSLNDESSVILFDMLEYYESAKHLNISSNQGIGIHGWQACASMIRKTQCLEHLEAKDVILDEQYMNILSRPLRLVCHLHVLKLENCGLSGRCITTLVAALKMNTGIRELYLADNGLNLYDAIQLGSLLRFNNHIQLLDISNNVIQDDGVHDILEGLINQINEDKDGKGLNILILWNNQLTKKSSPYFARIIALSKTLETLNIGKNLLTDELLLIIKDALKKNHVMLQLGMQSTDITCSGIVTLSEIIEINQVLQRIDLRNNNIQLTGMKALNSAMKKNTSIIKIDLDDTPAVKVDDLSQTLQQYTQLVAEIRSSCLENDQNRTLEDNSEGFENSYRSRFCSTTSRKISLTCQTLPCLSSMISIQKDDSGRSILEPKRINGGRLRSPAPSPASSPVASPILSPSRSRFVVSRVPETLRSTESSVSSSSIVVSSFGSSPTCVTSASGSSRFRVSVVESANTVSLPKPIITAIEADIQTDLKSAECISDDSNNLFITELKMNNDQTIESLQSTSNSISHIVPHAVKKVRTITIPECPNIEELNANKSFVNATSRTQFNDKISSLALEEKEDYNIPDNQFVSTAENIKSVENNCTEDTRNIKAPEIINKIGTDSSSTYPRISDKSKSVRNGHDTLSNVTNAANDSTELQSKTKHETIQKNTSNLGKLLSLFQHSSFFSDSTSVNQLKSKSPLQGSINSMMSLGDKFHYYIKDKKDRIYNRETEESSLSLKSKSKFFNVSQLPSLQSLANIIPSFKFESNINTPEQSDKPYCSKEANLMLQKHYGEDLIEVKKGCTDHSSECNKLNVYLEGQNANVSISDDQSLSEDMQSKLPLGVTNKDVVLAANCIVSNIIDTCSKIVNDNLLMHVSKSNTIVPVPKLIGIPEYSASKAATNNVQKGNIAEILDKVNPILIKGTNNKTLTDSINFTSDNNSLSCRIMYEVSNDMCTVQMPDRMHNLVILNLSTKDNVENNSVFNVNSTQSNTCFLCNGKCVCNVNNKSLRCSNNTLRVNVKRNYLTDEVTKTYSFDSNRDKNVFINVHNMPSNEIDKLNINDNMKRNNTDVNSIEEAKLSNINCICKDINFKFRNHSSELCTSKFCKNGVSPRRRKIIKPIIKVDKQFFKIRIIDEMQVGNSALRSYVGNTFQTVNIIMPIPRMYSSLTNFNMFTLRKLIHHVVDVCNERTSVKQLSLEITPNNWRNIIKIRTLFCNASPTFNLLLNILIEKSKVAGNAIENSFSARDYANESRDFYKEQKFVKNVLGIVPECLALPSTTELIFHSTRNTIAPKENNDMSENLSRNITQHLKCTNSDDISKTTDQYLNAITCAVATTMCSTAAVSTRNNTTIEIISDQSIHIAESSSVISATSAK